MGVDVVFVCTPQAYIDMFVCAVCGDVLLIIAEFVDTFL